MKKLWNKFDHLTCQCYESMIGADIDPEVWNQAYKTLIQIIEAGRDADPEFAPEFYELDEATDFEFCVEDWVNDYLDHLCMKGQYVQAEKVCRTICNLFVWKESSPTNFYFVLSEALSEQGKKEEAIGFCTEWLKKEPENLSAVAAMIYAFLRVGKAEEARKLTEKYLTPDMECGDGTDILFIAAEKVYEALGDKKAKKRISAALKQYEKELEDYMTNMDPDELEFW